MNTRKFDTALLADRLDLVRQDPAATHAWHRLFDMVNVAPPEQVKAVLDRVRAEAPTSGRGALLAATFANMFSNDVADLATASRVFVGSGMPFDAGLALLNSIYAAAVGSAGNADNFSAMVRESGFLDVIAELGNRLSKVAGPLVRKQRKRPLERVAVVTPTLSGPIHAPTEIALRHTALLLDQGLKAQIFAPQEFMMLDMPLWLGVPRMMKIAQPDAKQWPRAKSELTARLVSPELSMQGRWLIMLNVIAQFDPDVVLFVGPYSALLTPLQQRYPVVALGTHALAPIGPIDVWLAPSADAKPGWEPQFNVGRIVGYTNRFSLAAAPAPRDRKSLELPANATVWVTSGTRLVREITPEWRAKVMAALERHPQCHWLLVGMTEQEIASRPIQHPRVHYRGIDSDLPSLFKACNLYLNPPRMGGGHSVACAMAQGLPVLSLAGGDGGDKLGAFAQPDQARYFAALDALSNDAAALRSMGESLQRRYLDTFDLKGGAPTLLAALEEAASRQP
jgi:glycosyltransferase involved in cell wall biosynthesis